MQGFFVILQCHFFADLFYWFEVSDLFQCGELWFGKVEDMKWDVSFEGTVQKFPGDGGWVYVVVPVKYKGYLQQKRRAWGRYPITAHVGRTSWKTKLMMKKGGGFFVALKATIREKEKIIVGESVAVAFRLVSKRKFAEG